MTEEKAMEKFINTILMIIFVISVFLVGAGGLIYAIGETVEHFTP